MEKSALVVERVSCDELMLDPKNARIHPERNLSAIKKSLQRFGQQKPLVVGLDNVVIAGNGTLEAARLLGWSHIDIVRTALEGNDATAFAIADNRTAELAAWDTQMLSELLAGLEVDTNDVGWDQNEVNGLIATVVEESESPTEFKEFDETIPVEHKCPKCGYEWSGKSNSNA